MKKNILFLITLIPLSAFAIPWVEDAFLNDQLLVRFGYELLFQPPHSQRKFSNIQSIQLDLEKQWEPVRIFVTNAGLHFGTGDQVPSTHFADDLRFGAQYQFREIYHLYGGIRFWAKLPNTDDKTFLGTDETDFWFMLIESWKISDYVSIHLNFGLGIISDPVFVSTQDDYAVAGLRLDWWPTPHIPIQGIIHGFSGFKDHDDKLSVMIRGGYQFPWGSLLLELQGPLASDYADYADPLDHTAWGGMVLTQLVFH